MRYGGSGSAEKKTTESENFDDFDDFDEGANSEESGDDSEEDVESGEAPEPEEGGEPNAATPLWGAVEPPEWLLVGGSMRTALLVRDTSDGAVRAFPMQADLLGEVRLPWLRFGASVGIAKVAPGSPFARRAQVTRNQGDELNMISRTHFIGADFLKGALTARVGRLDLPFGSRIPEHTMWVRQATRTDRESSQQHGLALAYNGESVRGEAMAIMGNLQIQPNVVWERGYSAYVRNSGDALVISRCEQFGDLRGAGLPVF